MSSSSSAGAESQPEIPSVLQKSTIDVKIRDDVWQGLDSFRMPQSLGFGEITAPVMFSSLFEAGEWGRGELIPHGPIELMPLARVLHYAELVFEGLKAYRINRPTANLFRAKDNFLRFKRSADRIALPAVPEKLFFQAIHAVVGICTPIIPGQRGRALYVRPFLFGTEPGYIVRNSTTARFMVVANPVETYASGPMTVSIERQQIRAAKGGIGGAKTSGNYAASLLATTQAVQRGFNVALWLDPIQRKNIEELSGMNFFAVINNELHTPALCDSILAGVTRDSLIQIARDTGWHVVERPIAIDDLLEQISHGHCTELFATGTAAVVAPISLIVDADGREFKPVAVDVRARQLRERLLAIQERREPDAYGWITEVAPILRNEAASD